MIDLKEKIKSIIESETKSGHFSVLNTTEDVELIEQILSNYESSGYISRQDDNLIRRKAEMIFVAAPTGAGKDHLVAKLDFQNKKKKYVELNMDIFRYYFPMFMDSIGKITDKTFASKTNEFSYELYTTIQEIILQEFPGTNIIITGTLREIEWVEEAFKRFKRDKKTEYTTKLVGLAVPKKESAISVIYRYLAIVNSKEQSLAKYPGSARYTTMKYHDETFEKFPENFEYFERLFREEPGKLIDIIEVYMRSKDIRDLSDKSKVYSSEIDDKSKTALNAITELRSRDYKIKFDDFSIIARRIIENKDYLKSQNTLRELIKDLAILLNYPDIVKKLEAMEVNENEQNLEKN